MLGDSTVTLLRARRRRAGAGGASRVPGRGARGSERQPGDLAGVRAHARRAEFLSLPITLLILVPAFGTLVAAGLPLLLGLTAVVATIGLLGPLSHVIPVANAITSVAPPGRPGCRRDYSMFYIRRASATSARPGATLMPRLDLAAATSGCGP